MVLESGVDHLRWIQAKDRKLLLQSIHFLLELLILFLWTGSAFQAFKLYALELNLTLIYILHSSIKYVNISPARFYWPSSSVFN